MIEQIVNIDRMEHTVALFGNFDENIKMLEREYGVAILSRGSDIKVTGEIENVSKAVRAIESLLNLLNKGETINEQNVRYVISLVEDSAEDKIESLVTDCVCITAKGRPLKPKTLGQKRYIEALKNNTIVLGVGPAGTGKTYLAV